MRYWFPSVYKHLNNVILYILILFAGMCEHTQILCGSLLAEVTPLDKQSEVQGRLASVGGMGFIVGPVIGGHLAELNNGFQYICCVVTLIFFTNFGE
jgi:MFS family permease